jgi:hypothetical protein
MGLISRQSQSLKRCMPFWMKTGNRYKDDVPTMTSLPSRRLRWFVVGMLFGLSCASYVERVNISVAAELMMPALSLSKSDMSLIFNSFLMGYASFSGSGWLAGRSIRVASRARSVFTFVGIADSAERTGAEASVTDDLRNDRPFVVAAIPVGSD